MAPLSSINLFQSQSEIHPIVRSIAPYIRDASYLTLGIFILCGISLVSIRYFVVKESTAVVAQKNQALTDITKLSVSEGILLDLHDRIALVSNVQKVQVSFAPYIDVTLSIASPPRLTSFIFSENTRTVSISIKTETLSEAEECIDTVLRLMETKKLRNPTLTSLAADNEGTILLGLSYDVVL